MSVEAVLEAMRQHKVLLLRSPNRYIDNVWPVFTKGPDKGLTNWKKGPKLSRRIDGICDRWYTLEDEV